MLGHIDKSTFSQGGKCACETFLCLLFVSLRSIKPSVIKWGWNIRGGIGACGFSIPFFWGFRNLHLLSVCIKLGSSVSGKISIDNKVTFTRFITSLHTMDESEDDRTQ